MRKFFAYGRIKHEHEPGEQDEGSHCECGHNRYYHHGDSTACTHKKCKCKKFDLAPITVMVEEYLGKVKAKNGKAALRIAKKKWTHAESIDCLFEKKPRRSQ